MIRKGFIKFILIFTIFCVMYAITYNKFMKYTLENSKETSFESFSIFDSLEDEENIFKYEDKESSMVSYFKIENDIVYVRSYFKNRRGQDILQKGRVEGDNFILTHRFRMFDWSPDSEEFILPMVEVGIDRNLI